MNGYRIGLVGELDYLLPHLEGANFNPCGGPFAHDVTSEIDTMLKRSPQTPVLAVARPDDPDWLDWLRRLLDAGSRVVVIGDLPAGVRCRRDRQVRATATLADALIACGASTAMVPERLRSVRLAAREPGRSTGFPSPPVTAFGDLGERDSGPGRSGLSVDPVRRSPTLPAGAPGQTEARTGSPPSVPGPAQVAAASAATASGAPAAVTSATVAGAVPITAPPSPTTSPTTGSSPDAGIGNPSVHSGRAGAVAEIFDGAGGNGLRGPAEVVVVFGARGGVGKTSWAQALAGTAAARGLRAVLVDADKAQGDQALLLRLDPDRLVPSAYDAARTGRPADAIASPGLLDRLRRSRRDRVGFALVAAPPPGVPGSASVTTPAVYRGVIDHAARIGDLVVLDTHPVSVSQPTDMVTGLVLPLLRGGAWGLGLTDCSIPGLKHLEETLDHLADHGVPRDRLMTVVNRVPRSAELDLELLGERLSKRSHWVGHVYADDEDIPNRSNAGIVLVDVHAMAHQVERVLNRVCGLEVVTGPPGGTRRGLLGLSGRWPR